MFRIKYLLLLQIIDAQLQLNLHFTDVIKNNHRDESVIKQDCLYTEVPDIGSKISGISNVHNSLRMYCLSESLARFKIINSEFLSNFTFVQLAEMNVTSENLYLWSAPIDLIENYQYYLNGNDLSLSRKIFYNCTWPRFGSQCQYELDGQFSSLKEYINMHHYFDDSIRMNWTCYIHLQCIRLPGMRCLDWTDICDGKVDCLNNGVDEEHCWQLEINVCQDDEYRCYDGLCVLYYLRNNENIYESICLHRRDQYKGYQDETNPCSEWKNLDLCDNSACSNTFLTSSCLQPLEQDLYDLLYSEQQMNGSNITFILSVPILFDDIYIAYINNETKNLYLCTNNSQYEHYFVNHSKLTLSEFTCYEKMHWEFNTIIEDLFKYNFGSVHSYNRFFNYSSDICQRSNMYQCLHSTKCISIYRVLDDINDCPYSDDENENHQNLLENQYKQTHFQCPNSNKYIPHWKLENGGGCDCDPDKKQHCEDAFSLLSENQRTLFIFEKLCNGIIDHSSIIINGQNVTDETDCEHMPCYNSNYRCSRPSYCKIQNDENQDCNRDQTNMNKNENLQTFSISKSMSYNTMPKTERFIHCHRGIHLLVWLDIKKQLSTTACLCPSEYYGDRCQYQNQRVIFHVAFDTSYNHYSTFFLVSISLIDDSSERIKHSHQQFTLIKTSNCDFIYSLKFFYSRRPKDERKSYFIHVDIYERLSLNYRVSYLFPIDFPFLPVNLITKVIITPQNDIKIKYCSNRYCHYHGKCIFYWNNSAEITFCQCDRGWSGKYCTIQHQCMCSSDSLYMGVSDQNRSICLCPINRLGLRCLINDRICSTNQNQVCKNGGQCIANTGPGSFGRKFLCICPKGLHGYLCEDHDSSIAFSFKHDVTISSSINIHIFEEVSPGEIERTTMQKRISNQKKSVQLFLEHPYLSIFIENIVTKNYYLISYNNDDDSMKPQNIAKIITSSDRCSHITEIVNKTISNLYYIQRSKYYHVLCQNNALNLSCFHDDIYLCVCENYKQQRYAKCMTYDDNFLSKCSDNNRCDYNGQCFQYNHIYFKLTEFYCQHSTWCVCNQCYYGARCQFSTSGFGLTIDNILGYQIETQTKLIHQPIIVQVSVALTIIYLIIGCINSLLSLITFRNKVVHEVGCGLYLLSSSIITFIVTILFGLKMLILICNQIYTVNNELFLLIQCHSLDFLLRSCLYMNRWLSTSVAIERAVCAIQGVRFNKTKSKHIAKFIICFLLIFTMSTNVHESIYRKLINDENETDDEHIKRIWCITDYSQSSILLIYNNIIHTFHFFAPFACDLISSVILITKKSHHQANLQKQRTFRRIFREQFQEHKHLCLAPLALVILAIPTMIITYTSKCMESADDAWIYLIAYFISFIPPTLTFIIFVLPSKFYKKEFKKTIQRYRENIRRN